MICHVIVDAKMENFHHKALLVAGGHLRKAPTTLTYASIMLAADVLYFYINAPCHKKIWTTLQKEFGDDCSWKAIIVQAQGTPGWVSVQDGTTCLWSTVTQDASWTRLTAFFSSSLTQLVPPEMYLGAKLKKKTLRMVQWHGD
ncbi:hypothetical protein ACHAW6_000437 [Cyclotella cf. meneghiniana]